MLAADEKQTALQTIQAVVTAIAQNHYAAIPTLLSRSDLPMEELQGEIERVLRFQKTTVAPFSIRVWNTLRSVCTSRGCRRW